MSRFDRFSRVSAQERAHALERRAWRSFGLSLLTLIALACCGLVRLSAPQPQGQGNGLACSWVEPSCAPAANDGARPLFPLPPRMPEPEPQIVTESPIPPYSLPELATTGEWPESPPRQDSFSSPELPALTGQPSPPAPQPRLADSRGEGRRAFRAFSLEAKRTGATRMGGDYAPPAYKSAPKPPYPPGLKQMRIEGSVRVRIAISKEGTPSSVAITASSGHTEFDDAARQWILRHWRFTPALRNGIPVPSAVATAIHFVLD